MSKTYKLALDKIISQRTKIPLNKVSQVTTALYELLVEQLVHAHEATIPSVGTLRVLVANVNRSISLLPGGPSKDKKPVSYNVIGQVRLYFSKAPHLRAALKEKAMEKYGVDETVDQEELEKKASQGCPKCSRTLEKHGSVLLCPIHGTEPFEEKWQRR